MSKFYIINNELFERSKVLIVALLLFISNDTFFFGTNSIEALVSLPRYGAIALIVWLLQKKAVAKSEASIFVLLFLLLFYSLSCYIHGETITITGIYSLYILLAYYVATRIDYRQFWFIMDHFMYYLAIYSLFIILVAYIAPSIIAMFPVTTNSAGLEIYNMIFCGIAKVEMSTRTIRVDSIFWEPGVYQVYLNLFIAYQLFIADRPNLKKVVVYSLCVLFTFSTAGYIVLIFSLFLFSLFTNNVYVKKYRGIIISMLGLILLLSFFSSLIMDKVFSKITEEDNYSAVARYSSIVSNFYLAVENPLFGVGMGDMKEILGAKTLEIFGLYQDSNTNGVLYPLAAYGFPFGLMYILGLYRFASLYATRRHTSILFFVFLFLLFTGERLMSPLPYIMMFQGYLYYRNNEKNIVSKLS